MGFLASDIGRELYNHFCNKTLESSDVKQFIDVLSKKHYIIFEDFIKEIMSYTYIVDTSLPSWYVKLTKKCVKCSENMTIIDHCMFTTHYRCYLCDKLFIFNKESVIEENIIYDFINFICS